MKKKIYLYRLTDAKGDQRITVVDDLSNSGMIGGIGADGEYHQFDSYELYHAYDWAKEHGMRLEYGSVEIDIDDSVFVREAR